MPEPARKWSPTIYPLVIVAVSCVILLPNLGATRLWDMDEALYSSVAREMYQRDNWVVPWFNGELFPEKPPLMFWTMIGGFKLFGVNELGARFFSPLLGIATALVAFHLGRLLFSAQVGLWAGLATCSTIVFTISARAATVDAALALVTALAMLFFVLGRKTADHGDSQAEDVRFHSLRWPYAALMYTCMGLAVLAKGPVGMLLPLAAMGLYLLVVNGWRNILRSVWQLRPFTAIAVIAVVALPWYIEVGRQTDWEWPRKFFLEFNLRPFRQPIQSHGGVGSTLVKLLFYLYHIPGVLFGFFPWSVFLVPAFVEMIRRIRNGSGPASTGDQNPSRDAWREGCLLATCWFGVWFLFWSVCKTKLPHYLLPAYPALGLLVACWIDRWLGDGNHDDVRPWEMQNAWIATILAGLAIAIAVPIATIYVLPGEATLGLVGLILVFGGAWCWWLNARGQRQRAAMLFAATSAAFLTTVFGFAVLRVDRHQNAVPMIEAIHANWGKRPSAPPIATYGLFRESTVYYAGWPVTRCNDDPEKGIPRRQKLRDFVAEHAVSYVITSSEDEAEVKAAMPGAFRVIFRQRRFMTPASSKSREMVVLRATRKP
ncbi:MAG: glycosyltransferase family 39 protein [Thermoguttaceae bacterium]